MLKNTSNYNGKTVYNLHFFGTDDIYDFIVFKHDEPQQKQRGILKRKRPIVLESKTCGLKEAIEKNPHVNSKVFKYPASILTKESFSGRPIEEVVEFLHGGYEVDLKKYLKVSNEIRDALTDHKKTYEVKTSIYGGAPYPPLVAANINPCMLLTDESNYNKVANIFFNIAYSNGETKEQIINRGIATLSLIDALEEAGMVVNLSVFCLNYCKEEILNITIDLKSNREKDLNLKKLYFLMVAEEAFRRIIFRVIELSDVKEPTWCSNYGRPFKCDDIKKFYKTSKNDFIITSATEMGITGKNIYTDTLNMLKKLKLEEVVNVKQLKKLSKPL